MSNKNEQRAAPLAVPAPATAAGPAQPAPAAQRSKHGLVFFLIFILPLALLFVLALLRNLK